MKRNKIRKLIKKSIKEQVKPSTSPKFDPDQGGIFSTELNTQQADWEQSAGPEDDVQFDPMGGSCAPAYPGEDDYEDGVYQPYDESLFAAVSFYYIDNSTDNTLFTPIASQYGMMSIQDYLDGGEPSAIGGGGVTLSIHNTGNYCYGPVTIPTNWLCCVESNDSSTNIATFNADQGITDMFGEDMWGYMTYPASLGGENYSGPLMNYDGDSVGCYCPNSTLTEDGDVICHHDTYMEDSVTALEAFLTWDGGLGTSYLNQSGEDLITIPSVDGDFNYPQITSMCTSQQPTLPTACIDDGNLSVEDGAPFNSNFPALYSTDEVDENEDPLLLMDAQPACNYIGLEGAVDDDGNEFTGNFADYEVAAATSDSCDYTSCAGCMEADATNYDATATLNDYFTCDYAGCDSPYAYNYWEDTWDFIAWGEVYQCDTNSSTYSPDLTGCELCDYSQGILNETMFCGDPNALNYVCDATYLTNLGTLGDDLVLYACEGSVAGGNVASNLATFSMTSTAEGGACQYEAVVTEIYGCMDPSAENYNSTATSMCTSGDGTTDYYPNSCCIYAFCNDDSAGSFGYSEFHPSSEHTSTIGPTVAWQEFFAEGDDLGTGLLDGSESYFGGLADNSLCEKEGCRSTTYVPVEYQTGPFAMEENQDIPAGTPIDGLFSTVCGGTGRQMYYFHPDNSGCEAFDGDGASLGLSENNHECCVRIGCTDPNASNYDELSNYPPTVHEALTGPCVEDESATTLGLDEEGFGVPVGCEYQQYGCTDTAAINYNPLATDLEEGTCEYCMDVEAYQCDPPIPLGYGIEGDEDNPKWFYCMTIRTEASDYQESTPQVDDYFYAEGIVPDIDGCPYSNIGSYSIANNTICNYDPNATNVDNCIFPDTPVDQGGCGNPYMNCDCECLNDMDGDGVCDEMEVMVGGCDDPEAENFYCDNPVEGYECGYGGELPPEFTSDNSNCTYAIAGCTDPDSANFNVEATVDDGSCIYAGCMCCPVAEYSVGDEISYSQVQQDAQAGGGASTLPGSLQGATAGACTGGGAEGCTAIYGGYCYPVGLDSYNYVAGHCEHLVAIRIEGGHNMGGLQGTGGLSVQNTPRTYYWHGGPKCAQDLYSNEDNTACQGQDINNTGLWYEGNGLNSKPFNEKVLFTYAWCSPMPGSHVENWYVNGAPGPDEPMWNTPENLDFQQGQMCEGLCNTPQTYGCPNSDVCWGSCIQDTGGPHNWKLSGC